MQQTKAIILIFGGVVGTGNLGKTTVTNCYYLEGTCAGAVNLKDINEAAESRTEAQMKDIDVPEGTASFVDELNAGNEEGKQVWAKDEDKSNNGYPILKESEILK